MIINWESPQTWSRFHYLWLRDNCLCPRCVHPESNQRLVDTLQLPTDVAPASVRFQPRAHDQLLCIRWEDGHESEFPEGWLKEHSYEHESLEQSSSEPEVVLWGAEIASNVPEVEYSAVMEDDREVLRWLSNVEKFGFCFVCGTPATLEATEKAMLRVGAIRNTMYGQMYLTSIGLSGAKAKDTAYTNLSIDLHTDGNYFFEAPGIQVFHVLEFEGTGGQSILLDGFRLAQEICKRHPEHYQILTHVPIPYHHTDINNKMLNENITFVTHPKTGEVTQVHFNNSDRRPLDASCIESLKKLAQEGKLTSPPTVTTLYNALKSFMQTTKDESLQYRFRLEPGRLLTFNNYRVMHARTAFTGKRALGGCYLNGEDWVSRLMVLRERYQ